MPDIHFFNILADYRAELQFPTIIHLTTAASNYNFIDGDKKIVMNFIAVYF